MKDIDNILINLHLKIENNEFKTIEELWLFTSGILIALNYAKKTNKHDFIDFFSDFELYIKDKYDMSHFSSQYIISFISNNTENAFEIYFKLLNEFKYNYPIKSNKEFKNSSVETDFDKLSLEYKFLKLLQKNHFLNIYTFDDFIVFINGYMYIEKDDEITRLFDNLKKYVRETYPLLMKKSDESEIIALRLLCSNYAVYFYGFLNNFYKKAPDNYGLNK